MVRPREDHFSWGAGMLTDHNAIDFAATEILRIRDADSPAHIETLRARKKLSVLVHGLNSAALSRDAAAREKAQAALNHLGFI